MRSHLADARDRRSREVHRRLGRTGPRPHDGRPVNAKQTIVLVHGAYAESSSWNSVIRPLAAEGHRVIAWANPLRSVAGEALGTDVRDFGHDHGHRVIKVTRKGGRT